MKKVVVVAPQGPGRFVLATELSSAVNQLKISQNTVRGDSFKCGDPHCMCLNYVKHKWKPKVTLCVECGHPREYHTEAPVIPQSKAVLIDTGFSEEDEEEKSASSPALDLNLFQPLPPQLGAAGLNDMVEVTKFLNATLRNFIVGKRGGGTPGEDTGNLKIAEQELEIQLLKIALAKEKKASDDQANTQSAMAKLVAELQEVAAFAKLESARAKTAEQELDVTAEKLSSLMSSHIALIDKYSALSANNSADAVKEMENKVTAAEKALEVVREAHSRSLTELEDLHKRVAELQAAPPPSSPPAEGSFEAEKAQLVQEIAVLKQERDTFNQRMSELTDTHTSANAVLTSELELAKHKLSELTLSHATLSKSYFALSSSASVASASLPPIAGRLSQAELVIHSQLDLPSSSKSPPPPPAAKRQSLSSPPPPPARIEIEEPTAIIETPTTVVQENNESGESGEPPIAPPLTDFEDYTRARSRRISQPLSILEPPPSPRKESAPASSDPSVLSEMQQKVHMELVTTEETYLKGLRLLCHSFVIPLKALASDQTFGLTQDQLSSLCSNIETLLNFHTVFFEALSKPGASAGNTVLTYSDFFKMYIYYLNGYEKSLTTMDALRKHKKFQIFLSKVKFDLRKDGGLDLMSYLIMPVQRVPRYVMLLKELLKNTPATHPEHAALAEALSKVTAVAAQINEAKRHMENITQLLELQNQIVGELPGPLLVVGRVLLRRNLVYKRDLNGKKKMQNLFLFNDLVLWTSEGYRYKNQRALVATGMALEVDEKTKEAGVEITTNTDCILFYFPGPNGAGTLTGTLKPGQLAAGVPEDGENAAKEWIQAATTAKDAALQAREDKRKTRAKKLQASTSGLAGEMKTLMTSRLQELSQGKTTPLRQAYTRRQLEASSVKSFSALGASSDRNSTLERSHTLGKNLTLDHYVKPDTPAPASPLKRLSGSSGSTTNLEKLQSHRQTIFDRDNEVNKEHLSSLVKNATLPKDFVNGDENKAEAKTAPSTPKEPPPPKIISLLDFVDDMQVYCVRVQVFGAANLRKADAFGLSDPYCEITIAGAMQRTPAIYNTLFPAWNSTFYFLTLECPSEIKFELWDEDDSQTLKNDLLGLGSFSLQAHFNTQESKCAIPVTFKGEQKGTVDVAVLCKTCRLRK